MQQLQSIQVLGCGLASPEAPVRFAETDLAVPLRYHREASLVVDVAKTGCLGLGLRTRTERVGPESALVDEFLGEVSFVHSDEQRVFILKEPQIGQSFPDVVVVVYEPKNLEQWPKARRELTTEDLRLLQLIHTNRGASENELKFFLGKMPSRALERLRAAQMIERQGDRWHTREMSSIFALSSVLAFEAKMSPTSKVLEQALANKWFATNSAILVPAIGGRSRIAEAAKRHDLSVYTKQAGKRLSIRPKRFNKPLSYASWIINEWAWRLATQ
ncbi:MAG: hypothetical protein IPQ13_08050 [Holophagaceae bacterium]|nr:hypothetical protein [Holophagaceae bacterium]